MSPVQATNPIPAVLGAPATHANQEAAMDLCRRIAAMSPAEARAFAKAQNAEARRRAGQASTDHERFYQELKAQAAAGKRGESVLTTSRPSGRTVRRIDTAAIYASRNAPRPASPAADTVKPAAPRSMGSVVGDYYGGQAAAGSDASAIATSSRGAGR